MKMRFLAVAALAAAVGCASASTSGAKDAGVDMTVGHCDQSTLFASCSDQCGKPVCVVSSAMCAGSDWVCDCNAVQPCGSDMHAAD